MSFLNRARPRGKTELPILYQVDVGDYVTRVAVSRDGAYVAASAGDGVVSIFGTKQGERKALVEAHPGGALTLAWSPREDLLISGGQDGTAKLIALDGTSKVIVDGAGCVEHLAWSPNGETVACSAGRDIALWNRSTDAGERLSGHASTVTGVAFDASGANLYASCYGGVQVWSSAARTRKRHYEWKGSLISLCLSPDASVVACGSQDGSVHFWRTASGKDAEMHGYPSKPRALAWDNFSSMLATAGAPSVTVWDFGGKGPEGSKPMVLQGHQAFVSALTFAPKKALLASGGDDSGVLLWFPRKQLTPLGFSFVDGAVSGLAFHPSQRLLFAGDAQGTLTAIDVSEV